MSGVASTDDVVIVNAIGIWNGSNPAAPGEDDAHSPFVTAV